MDESISPAMALDAEPHPALIGALDLLLDVICVVDGEGRFVALSAACEQVFGYTPDELIGKPFLDLVLPEDRPRTIAAAAGVMSGIPLRNFENRYIRKDGQVVDIMWSARWSEKDQLRLAVAREVTARKRQEALQSTLYRISEAAHSAGDIEALLRSIHTIIGGMLPSGNFAVALLDDESGVVHYPYFVDEHASPPAPHALEDDALLAGVVRDETALLLSGEDRKRVLPAPGGHAVIDWLGVPLRSERQVIGALLVRSYDPGARLGDTHRELLHFVSHQVAANVQRKQAADRLRYLAQYDAMTGLPNRMLFDDRLMIALARASREGRMLALLYIDLDDFKPINDRFGHAAGDLLLQELARRILGCVRQSDTVSRIGGDEFIVLADGLPQADDALRIAEQIRAAIHQPFDLPRERVQVSASIGVAVCPAHAGDANQLVRHADVAMYAAKRRGGNTSCGYEPGMQLGSAADGATP